MSIEASFAKTPVMANMSCPGLNETMPKDWPLAVLNNDISQWYELIDTLDRYNAQSLGDTAYNFVKDRFTVEQMRKEYENLYRQKLTD